MAQTVVIATSEKSTFTSRLAFFSFLSEFGQIHWLFRSTGLMEKARTLQQMVILQTNTGRQPSSGRREIAGRGELREPILALGLWLVVREILPNRWNTKIEHWSCLKKWQLSQKMPSAY